MKLTVITKIFRHQKVKSVDYNQRCGKIKKKSSKIFKVAYLRHFSGIFQKYFIRVFFTNSKERYTPRHDQSPFFKLPKIDLTFSFRKMAAKFWFIKKLGKVALKRIKWACQDTHIFPKLRKLNLSYSQLEPRRA